MRQMPRSRIALEYVCDLRVATAFYFGTGWLTGLKNAGGGCSIIDGQSPTRSRAALRPKALSLNLVHFATYSSLVSSSLRLSSKSRLLPLANSHRCSSLPLLLHHKVKDLSRCNVFCHCSFADVEQHAWRLGKDPHPPGSPASEVAPSAVLQAPR